MTMVENLLSEMCLEPGHISHDQPEHINSYLKPMIQRDFISLLPDHVAENILYYLDADSLKNAELVSTEWFRVISEGMLWKKLIERKVRTDALWRVLAERRQWIQYLFKPRQGENHSTHSFYRSLYHEIIRDIDSIDSNWRNGDYISHGVYCRPVSYKGFYSLQYDDQKIVSGHCDNSIIIWDRKTLQRTKELIGHTGSVMHLQYDDKVIISGSCDCTVRVWNVNTGEMINTLFHHNKAVRHLKFNNGMLVTCSRDRSIAVWDMTTQSKITLRRVLAGHTAAVNMVDFDEKYIVSASDDTTIKVWSTSSCELVRTLNGHKHRITCFQYKDRLVVSGSADIRLWDIESGTCLRVINAHKTALVRSICFDSKRIITGAYNGKIKVWDLVAALDPQAPTSSLCLRTLVKHTDCVYRLQMNEYQIKSSSCNQIILTWDFLATSLSTVCTQQSSSSEYSD